MNEKEKIAKQEEQIYTTHTYVEKKGSALAFFIFGFFTRSSQSESGYIGFVP